MIYSSLSNLSNFYYELFQQLSLFVLQGLICMLPSVKSGIFDDVIITSAKLSDT